MFIFYILSDHRNETKGRIIDKQLEACLEKLVSVSVQSHILLLRKQGIDLPVYLVSTLADQTTNSTDYSRGGVSYLLAHLANRLIIWMTRTVTNKSQLSPRGSRFNTEDKPIDIGQVSYQETDLYDDGL